MTLKEVPDLTGSLKHILATMSSSVPRHSLSLAWMNLKRRKSARFMQFICFWNFVTDRWRLVVDWTQRNVALRTMALLKMSCTMTETTHYENVTLFFSLRSHCSSIYLGSSYGWEWFSRVQFSSVFALCTCLWRPCCASLLLFNLHLSSAILMN